jgi:hypothetical protein
MRLMMSMTMLLLMVAVTIQQTTAMPILILDVVPIVNKY